MNKFFGWINKRWPNDHSMSLKKLILFWVVGIIIMAINFSAFSVSGLDIILALGAIFGLVTLTLYNNYLRSKGK